MVTGVRIGVRKKSIKIKGKIFGLYQWCNFIIICYKYTVFAIGTVKPIAH